MPHSLQTPVGTSSISTSCFLIFRVISVFFLQSARRNTRSARLPKILFALFGSCDSPPSNILIHGDDANFSCWRDTANHAKKTIVPRRTDNFILALANPRSSNLTIQQRSLNVINVEAIRRGFFIGVLCEIIQTVANELLNLSELTHDNILSHKFAPNVYPQSSRVFNFVFSFDALRGFLSPMYGNALEHAIRKGKRVRSAALHFEGLLRAR